jgi:hypothetical protein
MRQIGEEDGYERQVGKRDHQGPDGVEEVKVDGVGPVTPVAELAVDCCLSVRIIGKISVEEGVSIGRL